MYKRGIAPVVAVTLLIFVTVVATTGFKVWYQSYQTGSLADAESKSPVDTGLFVQSIIGDDLYLRSGGSQTFSSLKIVDVMGNTLCEIKDGTISPLQADTRLLLTFDDGTAKDLSGYGNDGTINGANCIAEGISGYGCEFDGVNDYISVSHGDYSLDNNFSDITVSAWIYVNELNVPPGPADKRTPIIADWNTWNPGNQKGFNLAIFGAFDENVYSWTFSVCNGTNNYGAASLSESNFTKNSFDSTYKKEWVHVLGSYKNNDKISLYINGNLFYEKVVYNIGDIVFETATPINIGFSGINWGYFNGTIDEVAIYSKALTDQEVKALYKAGKAKLYEQLMGEGIKKIDVSDCNIQKGGRYEIIGFTEKGNIQQEVIAE